MERRKGREKRGAGKGSGRLRGCGRRGGDEEVRGLVEGMGRRSWEEFRIEFKEEECVDKEWKMAEKGKLN